MVLDEAQPRTHAILGKRESRRDLGRKTRDARAVSRSIPEKIDPRPLPNGIERLPPQVSPWIPRNREMVDVLRPQAADLETGADRLPGKARPVFYSSKTFLFNCGNELSAAQKRRGNIAMVGVDAQNVHSNVLIEVVAAESIIRDDRRGAKL
jgi:hypothetical protein